MISTKGDVEKKDINVKVLFDYPTIEGMIYKDTKIKVNEIDYDKSSYDEKVKGRTDVGKIVWVPRKLLGK
tara:strand:+ start:326 stop:535 length:210 start_codon:yes stop_codon:yes gene_type:complete